MYTDEIIDTHMHLWDLSNDYSWLNHAVPELEQMLGDYQALRKNFLIEDFLALARKNNITKSVHVEAFGFPNNPVAETQWLQQVAERHQFPHGIVAHAKLDDTNIDTMLARHTEAANVRGIRMTLNWHDKPYLRMTDRPDYMQDKLWLQGYSLLAKYNLVFDMQLYDHQLAEAIAVAKQFPEITMNIEHLAWPLVFTEDAFNLWTERLSQAAQCDNINIKLSCVGCAFQKKIPVEKIAAYIQQAIKLFGVNRCMFGSNFPPDNLFYTYDELINFFRETLDYLPSSDQRKIFYHNANKIYKL